MHEIVKAAIFPIITPVAVCNLCVCGMHESVFFFCSVIIEVTKMVVVICVLVAVVQHFCARHLTPEIANFVTNEIRTDPYM